MQSSGGLAALDEAGAHAALTVLSGPAGGAAGAAWAALAAGEPDALCFDMGGTSCDVCVIEGGAVREASGRPVGGRPVALPMLDVHTVGAGGGSIAWRDAGGALRVGPRSAPAPAPARPPTATAAPSRRSPTPTSCSACLGAGATLGGGSSSTRRAPRRRSATLGGRSSGSGSRECAAGIRPRRQRRDGPRAAGDDRRARRRPARPGAAAPSAAPGALHAAAIAEELGMTRILCPRAVGRARRARASSSRSAAATSSAASCSPARRSPATPSRGGGSRARCGGRRRGVRVTAELRYRGQAFELAVEADVPTTLREAFARRPRAGLRLPRRRAARWSSSRSASTATEPGPDIDPDAAGAAARGATTRRARACSAARSTRPRVITGEPEPGTEIDGPRDRRAARGDARRPARLVGRGAAPPARSGWSADEQSTRSTLRVVSGALRAACEEMGAVLIQRLALARTSRSAATPPARCSTPTGRMVMQAEHIPVHLGAMPAAVEAVAGEDHRAGASWVLNDPYRGGTHLPDITVDHAGLRRRRRRCSASRPTARTTPTSAGRRPARCPPTPRRSRRRAS